MRVSEPVLAEAVVAVTAATRPSVRSVAMRRIMRPPLGVGRRATNLRARSAKDAEKRNACSAGPSGAGLLPLLGGDQHVPRLGPLGGPDDPAVLHEVHQAAGSREPDLELALEHRCGADL